ncbi:hypothetical protein KIH31_04015 [Paenarthrobacter sp. DKR-5]|uniref:membrane protein YczE n=1 Tax=Paenarthrobacter sp. DKR-5 TaxID=2835535 RepID=UPI001BDCAA1D|nr:hypothetical protein [Paenarthrobacter sp. DKR-5]MBT1001760.1 hypothetical protein [Paenarthrobacter sp. DKR-5]
MRAILTSRKIGVRLGRLFTGLFGYGIAIALMIRANIGASPWDVFGQGAARTLGISFGASTIAISALVLLLWIPLRQRPGFGTISNAVLVGIFADLGLSVLPAASGLPMQVLSFAAGLALLAVATALYIGAGLGPGPRDGLMTGLVRVTGWRVWVVRTGIELSVVAAGWALGGVAGAGTVAFAAAVGPLTQLALRLLGVRLESRERPAAVSAAA